MSELSSDYATKPSPLAAAGSLPPSPILVAKSGDGHGPAHLAVAFHVHRARLYNSNVDDFAGLEELFDVIAV